MVETFSAALLVMSQQSEFWSAIGGALGGTIGGGLISYLIQIKILHERRRQRAEDHKRLQQVLGNKLIFKMMKIYSTFCSFHKHLEDSIVEAKQLGLEGESWRFIKPFANLPSPVSFSPEEMSMLMAMKNDNVFNQVLPMDAVHNSLLDVANTYRTERAILTERLRPYEFDGSIGRIALNQEQESALKPQMIVVNSIVEQLRLYASKGLEESKEAAYNLHGMLCQNLDLSYKLEFDFPSDSKEKPKDPPTQSIHE